MGATETGEVNADSRTTTTRAAERRTEILDRAAELFRRMGFDEIGIDDIGRAAGVSGPAIYRHFDGKQELLELVISRYVETLMEIWAEQERAGAEDAIFHAVVRAALDCPNEYYAYSHHRHLLEAERAERIRVVRRTVAAGWGDLLRSRGIVPGSTDARFRLVAMEGVLIHAALTAKASRSARLQMALRTSDAILVAELPEPVEASRASSGPRPVHHNRREAVFAAAISLFKEQGFTAVTLKDIGAEVGVSASAIHRHFDSKDSILATALGRSADQMTAAISVAIARSASVPEAVEDIAARFSSLFADHRELFGLNLYLATSLPRDAAVGIRQDRRMNLDEVAHLVRDVVPGLPLASARVRVGAMLSVLNNVVRRRSLTGTGNLAELLTVVSRIILLRDV